MSRYKLVKCQWFSKHDARSKSYYELYYLGKNLLGRPKWKKDRVYHPSGFGTSVYSGDLEWAKRIAKHYKIEVPR